MRRLRREWGYFGYFLVAIGLIIAVVAANVAWRDPGSGLLLLVPGSLFYFVGGFFVVLSNDYRRGTKAFITLSFLRLVFAAATMTALIPVIRR